MTTEPLCITCGYYVATIGDQCDTCRSGDPFRGLEAAIVSSAIQWRRSFFDWDGKAASQAQCDTLADAVDRLLEVDP